MGSRFISAVAFYGPKTGPLRELLAGVQALIAEHVGEDFRPYSLEQVHATLIALNGVRDPETGAIVNEYLLAHAGVRRQMDLPRVMDILARARPHAGAYRRLPAGPGGALHQPGAAFGRTGLLRAGPSVRAGGMAGRLARRGRRSQEPLDDLRREMNAAHVLHRYHVQAADVDNDLHLVVGHHAGAPPGALARATAAVRDKLAADPVDLAIGLADIKIVAADAHTLAPPQYVGDIPAAEATLLALMQ